MAEAATYQIVRFDTNGGYTLPPEQLVYEYECGKTFRSQKRFPPNEFFEYTLSGGLTYEKVARWGGRNGQSWGGIDGDYYGPTGVVDGRVGLAHVFSHWATAAFLGWYTLPVGGVKVNDTEICGFTKDTTLYAHWDFTTARLWFDPQGGEFAMPDGSRTSDPIEIPFDFTYSQAYTRLPRPSRSGYKFLGWYTLPRGTTLDDHARSMGVDLMLDRYPDQAYLAYPAGGMQVRVTDQPYDATGLAEGTSVLGWVDLDYNDINPPRNVAILTFGWTYDEYSLNGNPPQFPILYAHWVDGSSSVVTVGETSFEISHGGELPTVPVPSRDGYEFVGYFTGADGTGRQYYDETGTPVSRWEEYGDVTLHPAWRPLDVTVTFVCDGAETTTKTVVVGGVFGAMPEPHPVGRRFVEWADGPYSSSNAVTSSTVVPARTSITLYGRVEALSYPVYLETFGRGVPSGAISSYTYGSTIRNALPSTSAMESLVSSDWTFGGWYDNVEFSGEQISKVPTNRAYPQTFYAKWVFVDTQHIIIYHNLNGLENDAGGYTSVRVTVGHPIGEVLPGSLERDGYDFAGWYLKPDSGSDEYVYITPEYLVPDRSSTLYVVAKWEPVKEGVDRFHVKFGFELDLNGGTLAADYTHGKYVYGYARALPTSEQITKDGAVFGGWYASPSFDGDPLVEIPVGSKGRKRYYARWVG